MKILQAKADTINRYRYMLTCECSISIDMPIQEGERLNGEYDAVFEKASPRLIFNKECVSVLFKVYVDGMCNDEHLQHGYIAMVPYFII